MPFARGKRPLPDMPAPDSPAYHGTKREHMPRIKARGLESNERVRNDYGEKRGEDYDTPQTEHLIYYTREPGEWGDILLRFDEDEIPDGAHTDEDELRHGEYYITSDEPYAIPPERLHYRHTSGVWRPVLEYGE